MFLRSFLLLNHVFSSFIAAEELQHELKEEQNKVESLLDSMTLREKVAQMIQIDISLLLDKNNSLSKSSVNEYLTLYQVGSVLNIPMGKYFTYSEWNDILTELYKASSKIPILYGLDSVHGANFIPNASLTPQPLNLAASFDREYAYRMGVLSANHTPPSWLFSPILGLGVEPKWGRLYETFGEDPYLVSEMTSQVILGIQQSGDKSACGKHFVGYSDPTTGHDRAPSWIPKRQLFQYFIPPWEKAIKEGNVKTIMTSYTEFDGVPNTMNSYAVDYILRHRLGFEGVVVTDYREIYNLVEWHETAQSLDEAIKLLFSETSIDMLMAVDDVMTFLDKAVAILKDNEWLQSRIDASVKRILNLKSDLGLLSTDFNPKAESQQPARNDTELLEMTRDSIILVKNHHSVLPILHPMRRNRELNYNKKQILITGPTADSLSIQSGGWTGIWQGQALFKTTDFFNYGATLRDALNQTLSQGADIHYACGVDILGESCIEQQDSLEQAINISKTMNLIIIALGEEPYAEKPGDIRDLDLPSGQYDLVKQIKKVSSEKTQIILVYFGGRPRILRYIEDMVDGIILAFLPGPYAGPAITDIITGAHNPCAKLPITYPKYQDGGGSPYYHTITSKCTKAYQDIPMPNMDNIDCSVQWPFGHGLSYTKFFYSKLHISSKQLSYDKPQIDISVHVKNTGSKHGKDVVFFYIFCQSRYVTPEYKKLHYFQKTKTLKSQSSETVSFSLTLDELRYIGIHDDSFPILQNGMQFRIGVGNDVSCRFQDDPESSVQESLCTELITINAGDKYIDSCDTACELWNSTDCFPSGMKDDNGDLSGCRSKCYESDKREGWGWEYVHCIDYVLQKSRANGNSKSSLCHDMTKKCMDVFHVHADTKVQSDDDDDEDDDTDISPLSTSLPTNHSDVSPIDAIDTNPITTTNEITPQQIESSEGESKKDPYKGVKVIVSLAIVFAGFLLFANYVMNRNEAFRQNVQSNNDLEFVQVREDTFI